MVRTRMFPPESPPEIKTVARKEVAYILDQRGVRQVEADLPTYEYNFDSRDRQQVQVHIPGEFNHPLFLERSAPGSAGADSEEEAEPKEPDPKAMALPPPGAPWSSADQFLPEHERSVYFATNRNVLRPKDKTVSRFGNSAATMTYGSAVVNIPIENHRRGELETPGYWSSPDPKRHFIIQQLTPLSRGEFQEQVTDKDILIYVHGYNTSFEFAVLRGGQLQHDLQFPGRTVVFSWPSSGTLTGYTADEEQSARSVGSLVQVFEEIHQVIVRFPERRIHVIAHSMGNRVLLAAVREWELKYAKPSSAKLFSQVILAAPDVDAAMFAALLPSVIRASERATLYYCPNDNALLASQALHVNKPVGLGPFFTDGLDTINAEQVDTSMIGHGYYAAARELLLDLRLMISYTKSPDDRRPPLGTKTTVYGYPLWAFVPIVR
jgi:esterase/lipase superfamily enzyme